MSVTITEGTVHVFTYKDGPLARFAHDLRLSVEKFAVTLDAREVRATFDARTLRVDGVVKGARVDAGALGEKDRRDILDNLASQVLRSRQHPEILYTGRVVGATDAALTLRGSLRLVGREGPLEVQLRRRGERAVGEASLMQTRWGIQPFSAMLGAIKIKNVIDVRFDLPAPTDPA
jgi:hypothetical protein